jgi:hypothetical protein
MKNEEKNWYFVQIEIFLVFSGTDMGNRAKNTFSFGFPLFGWVFFWDTRLWVLPTVRNLIDLFVIKLVILPLFLEKFKMADSSPQKFEINFQRKYWSLWLEISAKY